MKNLVEQKNLANVIRPLILMLAFFLLVSSKLQSQNVAQQQTSVSLSGNTGVGLSGPGNLTQTQLNPGQQDSHWSVNTTTATGNAAVAISPPSQPTTCLSLSPNGPGGSSSNFSSWITIGSAACGNVAGNYSCITTPAITQLYFKNTFTLNSTPMFSIDWQLHASDWIDQIIVNGMVAYNYSISVVPTGFSHRQNPLNFKWCTNWLVGHNEIIVRVRVNANPLNTCKIIGLKVVSWGTGASINISGPTLLCNPSTGQYTTVPQTAIGIPTNMPVTYQWKKQPGWGGPNSNNNMLSVSVGTNTGMLSVAILTTTSWGFQCIKTGGYSITIPPPLTVTPISPTVCSGKQVTLTVSGANTYTWYAPNGTPIGNNPVLVTTTSPGGSVYNVKGGGTGCVYTKSVTVNTFVTPNVAASLSPTAICINTNATLMVTGTAWQYSLLPGPANPQVFPNVPILISKSVTTTYTVRGRSIPGCTNSVTFTLTVIPQPTVNVVATPSVICPGGSSSLLASGATIYSWSPVGGTVNPRVVSPPVTTVYSVKGTQGPCSSTKTVQVGVLTAPVISVSPPAICPGITNTVSATGALSYTWIVGPPILATYVNTPNINITSSVAVSYTVLGSGPVNNCVSSVTGTVPLGAPIPINAPNAVLCTNGGTCTNISATSTLAAPVNYVWQTGSGSLNGSTVSVCPAVPTIYTVSATSSLVGCPNSATMLVTIASNCCPQPTVGMTQLTNIGGVHLNTSYVLSNSSTLSASAFFINSEVWITEGVSITVPSGMQLDLDKTHLFGCGINMWQGIVVQDGGRITTVNTRTTNSMIEDAVVAIDLDNISLTNASPAMPIDISRIIFNRNYIGIKISNSVPTLTSLPLGINGCVFASRIMPYTTFPSTNLTWPNNDYSAFAPNALRLATSPTTGLVPPYGYMQNNYPQANLKLPYPNQPAHIGIKIENIGDPNLPVPASYSTVGVEIGFTNGNHLYDFNLFDGIGIGVDIKEASFTAKYNVFQNMQYYQVAGGAWFGGIGINHEVAITAAPHFARLELRYNDNHFWDCNVGIKAMNVNQCFIHGSVFRSTHSVATAQLPSQTTQGDVGVYYEAPIAELYVYRSQFNNIRDGIVFKTPQSVVQGSISAYFAAWENYFGAQVTSTAPYTNGGIANNSEYMSTAIDVTIPNTSNSVISPITDYIISNKINRAFRGVSVNGLLDMGLSLSANEILIEEDATYNGLLPQYGIALQNNIAEMRILSNTVQVTQNWSAINTNSVSAYYFYNNTGTMSPIYNLGSTSPVIFCNGASDAYYGFHFDGPNVGTNWGNNAMCSNWAGLALTNSAVIGQQGNPAQAINNVWLGNPNCGQWGAGLNAFHETYCENSDPTLSPLYVMNLPSENPVFNFSFPNPMLAYDMGGGTPSIFMASGPAPTCTVFGGYGPPPSWRMAQSASLTAIDESLNESNITIFPNPTNGFLTIASTGKEDTRTVSIYDLAGKQVFYKTGLTGSENIIDVAALAPGIYLIEVNSQSGKTIRKKLVKTD